MQFIHDNVLIDRTDDVLLDKWKTPDITGDIEIEKPSLCIFNNTKLAIEMLNKHMTLKSKIGLHIDVDVDGIGSGYILSRFLYCHRVNDLVHMINKGKVHGIQDKHVNYVNNNSDIRLMIISDSSCNEIDLIKQFNCDVLVVDHHEILHNDLHGKCNDGIHEYVIVNNILENTNFDNDILWLKQRNTSAFNNIDKYTGDSKMSCGLVIYELLRVYCECFSTPNLMENLMLYQWAGVTLLTDAIQLKTPRNQWYMHMTVHNTNMEHSLKIMQELINRWKVTLDKTYINYSFAPIINKAIRADANKEALQTVIFEPDKITDLNKYKKNQDDAVNKVIYSNYEEIIRLKSKYLNLGWTEEETLHELRIKGYVTELLPRRFDTESIMIDISSYNISPNYTGVIAGRLSGENNKNTACYIVDEDGMAKGSFRGRLIDTDYRKYFEKFSNDIYAQGHAGAFGFRCTIQQLRDIMNSINSIETETDTREYFSVGNMPPEEMGVFHIVSFSDFKKNMYLIRIANGNSKLTSADEVNIKVSARDVVLKEIKGKLFIYDVLGLECKAFKQLAGDYFKVYLEYTNELNAYIKPI